MEQKVANFSPRLQESARAAKLLGHPARLMILEHLATSSSCHTGDLSALLPLSRTTTNQHLEALKKAGWVKGSICGSRISYCLDNERITKELGTLTAFIGFTDTLSHSNC